MADPSKPRVPLGAPHCAPCLNESRPIVAPIAVQGGKLSTAPGRPQGRRCADCTSSTFLCAGQIDPSFCAGHPTAIAGMTAFAHSLRWCKDLRELPPGPPVPPARDGRLRVALFGPCLQGGGAEEWQR